MMEHAETQQLPHTSTLTSQLFGCALCGEWRIVDRDDEPIIIPLNDAVKRCAPPVHVRRRHANDLFNARDAEFLHIKELEERDDGKGDAEPQRKIRVCSSCHSCVRRGAIIPQLGVDFGVLPAALVGLEPLERAVLQRVYPQQQLIRIVHHASGAEAVRTSGHIVSSLSDGPDFPTPRERPPPQTEQHEPGADAATVDTSTCALASSEPPSCSAGGLC